MKKIFLLVNSFFILGCFDVTKTTPAFIYPKENIARVRQVTSACPFEVSEAKEVSLMELNGWVCIPPDQAQKIRQEYVRTQCKDSNLQAAPQEESTEIFSEELNANIKLWFSKATN